MNKEIQIGDLGVFSARTDKNVKVLRVDDKYVTYLIIDEDKKKYIYLEDFKKKFTKEGESKIKEKIEEKKEEKKKEEKKKETKIKEISENKKTEKTSKPTYTIVGVYKYDNPEIRIEENEDLNKENLLGYRIRYNKEPLRYFGYVEYDKNDLEGVKKRLQYIIDREEKEKEYRKIKDAENKIKREENKIIQKEKLESANKEIIKKPSYLMTLSEYENKVVPILAEYQKFLRKNSKYLQSADYAGIYQYTYPELEEDVENKTVKGWKFSKTFYNSNALKEFKASHYPSDEIVAENKSFKNKLLNFFSEKEIFSELSKDEFKSNKRAVRRAIDNDTYKKLLEDGELTEEQLEVIAKSVDVTIPKKVFSVENVKAKEMKANFEKLLVDLPTISKEQLNKLIESIKIDFKPLEEEIFIIEKARYTKTFEELVSEAKVYELRLNYEIPIWQELFTYDKRGYDEIKTGRYYRSFGSKSGEEIIEQKYYVIGLKLKSNWETIFDKFLKDYIDTLKYSFIKAIINNFYRITKPIVEFKKLIITRGKKGFEGVYRFIFDDGSYFDFKAEAIRAGGYNIQILHLRYITNFENITLADGTKVKGYENLIENFNVKRMEKGGEVANKEFFKWYLNWYKNDANKNMSIMFSLPSELTKLSSNSDSDIILDVFEKNNDNVDAKKYLQTITDNADKYGVTIYLQPIPRTSKLKSDEHKKKITKDYLIEYYNNFGFKQDKNDFMVREPKMSKGGLTHDDIKNKTDKYKGILKKPSSLLKISLTHKVPMFFLQSQLRKGMKVESEHTNREVVAKIIALHHLEEDPNYYIKLEKIEGKMADGGKMAKGGEIDPDNKSIKSAMTHKAGSAGGLLVGNRHSEGGIKAINKSTNTPIEMEGGEVVITRNAVSDNNKREFEGQMLTNREILSKINESGGGVSFASGGKVPSSCKCSGKSYKYGGENITDYDIVKRINSKC